jgi:hypothetical protein
MGVEFYILRVANYYHNYKLINLHIQKCENLFNHSVIRMITIKPKTGLLSFHHQDIFL